MVMQYLTSKLVASVRWLLLYAVAAAVDVAAISAATVAVAVLVIINADANMSNVVNINHRQRKSRELNRFEREVLPFK